MKRFDLQDIFFIDRFSKEESHHDQEFRNYFEIIFIEAGVGIYHINDYAVPYKKGDVFLIAPNDTYHFKIQEETQFCYFHFSELLFSNKVNLPDRSHWLHRIEHIISKPDLLPGDLIKESHDRNLIWHIHKGIFYEFEGQREFYRHNISNMINTILSVLARNINAVSYTHLTLPTILLV